MAGPAVLGSSLAALCRDVPASGGTSGHSVVQHGAAPCRSIAHTTCTCEHRLLLLLTAPLGWLLKADFPQHPCPAWPCHPSSITHHSRAW